MSAWAEVDAMRTREAIAQHQRQQERAPRFKRGAEPLCAFAKTENGRWRFRARADEARIKVEVMPHGFRFNWRSWGYYAVSDWLRVAPTISYGQVNGAAWLSLREAEQVLVARDRWLEAGGKVMTRPTVIR